MENKEEIVIKIYINNYSNNKTILATLSDATVKEDDEEKLLITYKFFPQDDSKGGVDYQFTIFKGEDETKIFGAPNRKYLNIKVIKALRDVESELSVTDALGYPQIDGVNCLGVDRQADQNRLMDDGYYLVYQTG